MNVIGVLDLLDGQAVHAVAGKRDQYRPVRSRLCQSSDPVAIAEAYRSEYDINTLYVADLDGLAGRTSNRPSIDALIGAGFELVLDPGLRAADEAADWIRAGVGSVVIASETSPVVELIDLCVKDVGPDRLLFSLDFRSGTVLGGVSTEQGGLVQSNQIIDAVVSRGVRRWIVLDLATVGTGIGPATIQPCEELRQRRPTDEILTGGGVKKRSDLVRLQRVGVDGVLLATALHSRALTAADVQSLQTISPETG